jgi:nucleotide-binding universal stress UspA family protein
MFRKILVAMDGSELDEVSSLYGRELASNFGSELTLFHVCAPHHQKNQHMIQSYLKQLTDSFNGKANREAQHNKPIKVKSKVLVGEPVATICNYIAQNKIELMVLAAKPPNLLGALGSVTDKVFQVCSIPTMLVRGKVPTTKRIIKRILVPVNGSDINKIVLAYTEELAQKLNARVTLLRVLSTTPPANAFIDELHSELILKYLQASEAALKSEAISELDIAEHALCQRGITVRRQLVEGIDPAETIIEMSQQDDTGLVIMTTRGESPLRRRLTRSTADKVLRYGEKPLLLIKQG